MQIKKARKKKTGRKCYLGHTLPLSIHFDIPLHNVQMFVHTSCSYNFRKFYHRDHRSNRPHILEKNVNTFCKYKWLYISVFTSSILLSLWSSLRHWFAFIQCLSRVYPAVWSISRIGHVTETASETLVRMCEVLLWGY